MIEVVAMVGAFAAMAGGIMAARGHGKKHLHIPRPRKPSATPMPVYYESDMRELVPDMRKALKRWHRHMPGLFELEPIEWHQHKTARTEPSDGVFVCRDHLGALPEGKFARTFRYPDEESDIENDAPIDRAKMVLSYALQPGTMFRFVFAHELGHAAGWKHPASGPAGGLMNRGYERIGWGFWGIE